MKNSILLLLTLCLFIVSCGNSEKSALTDLSGNSGVEVLSFHGDMRCRKCFAMEKIASEVLKTHYQDELNDGKIIYKTIDITTPEGEQIADKYEISWSALVIVKKEGAKEEYKDLTKEGFKYAVKEPDKLKGIIANQINLYLK